MIIINKSHLKVVKIHKSVVIHLKLTATQKSFVNWILGCKRLVWNDALEYKQYLWETYKRRNPCIDNLEELAHIYDLESNTNIQKAFAQSRVIEYPGYEFLSKCPARCITQVLNDLNLTFSSFLNKKSGYPRFKRKKDPVQSIRFDDQLHIKKLNKKNIYVRRGKLFKFKGVNPAITNEDIFLKKMKNITIKKDNLNSYYAILNYDAELKIEESVNKDKIVAIDVGITDGVVTSSNQRFNLPKNKMQGLVERRKKKQIQLKTKQKGSLAYIKKLNQIRKIYKKEANIRKEYNHQISKELANKHGLIIREDLKIEFMLKSLKGTKDNPGKNVKLKTKLNNKASNQG